MPPLFKQHEPSMPACGDRLAVNLADLDRIDPFVREAMGLAQKLDATAPIYTDPDRWDETAVAFRCDLLTAACLLDVIRDHDRRAGAAVTRTYVNKGYGWVKLPGGTTLVLPGVSYKGTTVADRLNPDVFNVAAEHAAAPPKVERVF